jgi:hypothetical protein
MINKTLSRRNFIKLSALSIGTLAFKPMLNAPHHTHQRRLMRVAGTGKLKSISIRQEPNDDSKQLYQRFRDDIINVYYEVESEFGPEYNPIWYRVWGGYAHRAHLQEVQHILNPLTDTIHEDGQLGEITVPYTRAYRYTSFYGWTRVYRLYYQTLHWIRDIITGPDGKPWYQLEDELLNINYAIPAEHMRVVDDSEFDPIAPDLPLGEKRIEISIARQELTAFEGDVVVFKTNVSTGQLTPERKTPTGEFRVSVKMPSKHMGHGNLTDKIDAYELVGVPWNCFFSIPHEIASHGTFWHNNFGVPMSQGCINMRNHEAKWLYRWSEPIGGPHQWTRNGFGTRVSVV